MTRVNTQRYVETFRKKLIYIVKANGKIGEVSITKIHFPKADIGKRIRIKIEVVKEGENGN